MSRYTYKSTAQIKKVAARNFQKYIRIRDAYNGGWCITCGKPIIWNVQCDAGHLVKRRHTSTLLDERNCNAQCKYCNQWKSGNDGVYVQTIDLKWGKGTYNELTKKKNDIIKRGKIDYIAINEYYLKKINDIKKGLIEVKKYPNYYLMLTT